MTDRPPTQNAPVAGEGHPGADRSQADHFQIFEQSPLSIQVLDPDGRTVQVNRTWERLWGGTLEMLHDYNMLEDKQLEEKGILPYIRRGFAGETVEIPPIHYYPDRGDFKGTPRWVRAFIYPILQNGKVVQVVLIHEDITDRKQVEQEVASAQQRHRAIFENARDAILLANDSGRFIDVNPAAEKLTGYTREELLKLTISDLTSAQSPAQFEETWQQFGEQGYLSGEYSIRRKDGSTATTQYRALANVLPGLHVSILQDTSDTKQAEARFRELADSMPAIVWSSTPTGETDFLNRWYYDYTGLPFGTPGLEGWNTVVHPDDLGPSQASYRECFQAGRPWIQEIRLRRADGTYRWHLSRSVPVRDASGNIHRWFATSTDIHDQKEAEAKAREEAAALEIVNRVGHSLSSELELDRLVQTFTDAATELVGAQFGSFFYNVLNEQGEAYMLYTLSGVPRSAFERFPMPRNTAIFNPTFQGEGVVRSDDITKDPRYGQSAPYHGMPEGHLPVRSYLALPVVSRAGDVIGGLFFGHSDQGVFTERHERMLLGIASQAAVAIDNARLYTRLSGLNNELEGRVKDRTAQLQAANREMEGFTYSVSHDLRGPLRAIMSTSMILQEDYATALPDEAKEQLQRQAQAARKLGDLIDDLLRLSRLGRQEMAVGDVDLSAMANEIVDEIRTRENCEKLEFVVQPSMHAKVDSKLVRLVLGNLLDNACKFSPNGGTITFGTAETDKGQAFYVRDQGIGFDMKYQQKMFQPFERLVLDSEFPGTGIGLANVKRIVERHGGQVWAEGALGQGATLYFTLP